MIISGSIPLNPGESRTFTALVAKDENYISGQTVTFSVSPDDGTVSLSPATATTGSDGRASTSLITGSGSSGTYTVTATLDNGQSISGTTTVETPEPEPEPEPLGNGLSISGTATVDTSADEGSSDSGPSTEDTSQQPKSDDSSGDGSSTAVRPAILQTLTKVSGDEQQGPAGTALAARFVVSVLDQNGSPLAGVVVSFSVTAGGGTLSATTTTTDANGRARSRLTLGPDPGTNTVAAIVEGLEPVTFTAIGQATADSDGAEDDGKSSGEDQQDSEETPTSTVELDGISSSHTSVRENDEQATSITLTVTLDKAAATDETVTLALVSPTQGNTAKHGEDFDATLPETLTIAKGQRTGTAQLTLTPKDNTTADGDKAFAVQATSSSGHSALINIKIVDDEMDDGTPTEGDESPQSTTQTKSTPTEGDESSQSTTQTTQSTPTEGDESSQSTTQTTQSTPTEEPNTLTRSSGEGQEGQTGAVLAAPFVVSVLDQNGSAFAGAVVTFSVTAGGGTLSVDTATTDASGRARSTLTLGPEPGTNTVSATVAGLEPETFTATAIEQITYNLTKVSGEGQGGPASTQLAKPFVVSVLDQDDSPLAGVAVTFSVTAGGGLLASTTDANPCTFEPSTSSTTATTDANGRARTYLTLGSELGTNTVSATIAGLEPVTFTATAAEQATPHHLIKICGEDQEGTAGALLAKPFVVSVVDENGTAIAGVAVSFAVTAGGGTLTSATATTNANGHARTRLTLGSDVGTNTVSATVEGLEPVIFTAVGQENPLASMFDAFFGSGKLVARSDSTRLLQNAPNPFNSQTVLSYFLPESGSVRLELFSLTGQRVAVLHQGPQEAGYHRLHWDGRDDAGHSVASGTYLYRLVTSEDVLTRKLILLR